MPRPAFFFFIWICCAELIIIYKIAEDTKKKFGVGWKKSMIK